MSIRKRGFDYTRQDAELRTRESAGRRANPQEGEITDE